MPEPFQILFVCTGNSCRSPMGEALLKKHLQDKNLSESVKVTSAGTFALDGRAASPEAVIAVDKFGASLEGFQSQMLTPELVEQSHLILVMESNHLDLIQEHYPTSDDKVRILGQYLYPSGPEEIPDPIGAPQQDFDSVAELIEECLFNLLREWDATIKRYYSPRKKIVSIGVDHRGWPYKEWLIQLLQQAGCTVVDCGTQNAQSCDHPDFAFKASELVSWRKADRAVLVCATGHGMLLSANKVLGIRCVMPINEEHAVLSRQHNNTNVLAFGTDFHTRDQLQNIIPTWLKTDFWGNRYQRRVRKITHYERGHCP